VQNFVTHLWHIYTNGNVSLYTFSLMLSFVLRKKERHELLYYPLKGLRSHKGTHVKTPFEINFIYLGIKEVYCIFKTCCIMFYYYATNTLNYHRFIITN
jgi:hypothetical protein